MGGGVISILDVVVHLWVALRWLVVGAVGSKQL
jgi:hypothetical protein